jgi:hypothetical protein
VDEVLVCLAARRGEQLVTAAILRSCLCTEFDSDVADLAEVGKLMPLYAHI